MSNFNEKIKQLLAFSNQFESFKTDIAQQIERVEKLAKSNDSALTQAQLDGAIKPILEKLTKLKSDSYAFDSARRTFGEEVGVLKSHTDKEFRKLLEQLSCVNESIDFISKLSDGFAAEIKDLKKSVVTPKNYYAEIKALAKKIESIKIPADQTSKVLEIEKAIKSIPAQKNYSVEIENLGKLTSKKIESLATNASVKELIASIENPKSYDHEIKSLADRVKKIESIKPAKQVDHKPELTEIKKAIAAISAELKTQKSRFSSEINKASKSKPVDSLVKSVADLNKKLSDNTQADRIKELEQQNAALKKQLESLSSEFKNFKNAFEE